MFWPDWKGPLGSNPIEVRELASDDFRALFHCFTSSTAWLKFDGARET